MKKKFDPKNIVLTKEEQEIEDSLPDNPQVLPDDHPDVLRFKKAAEYTRALKNRKAITLRLAEEDIIKMKNRAQDVGIPYQNIIASLVHQYVNGKIDVRI